MNALSIYADSCQACAKEATSASVERQTEEKQRRRARIGFALLEMQVAFGYRPAPESIDLLAMKSRTEHEQR